MSARTSTRHRRGASTIRRRPTGRQHEVVGAIRRPGPERPDRDRVAREPRHRASPRHASNSSLGALVATRSQLFPQIGYSGDVEPLRESSRVSLPPLPPRADNYFTLYQAALGAIWQLDLFGRVRRLTRSGAGPGLRERAGAARRRADDRRERRDELHRDARAGPSARDRAGDGGELRRDGAHLRSSLQARHRLADRGVADRFAVPAGAGRDSRRSNSRSPPRRT